ncbi:hypothetical protein EZV62_022519 [Acer yangbiense]|uniref:Cyclin C-terminal domain-containing protein n=1 Tax=Acer yangbiense TaxID=1000413 RepID=A0A5C7H8K4_9ROSI|nr:hypothetical protein EZV62_022519 [Acer yangbiense]
MTQLAAVACLSLAAKVEETQVPLLLDLQAEDAKYVFEAKTIQRMELLLLLTLKWTMNPVTPISFFDHIVRRLGLKTRLHWEFLRRCERLLLSIITDSRFMCYLPSILATATMMHVIKEVEPYNHVEYQNQLMGVLKISEDKVNECYTFILELSSSHGSWNHHKRKHVSLPGSPSGVIDATFSCDSSNDSWALASSVSSSLEPRFKRNRAHVQQMRLPSLIRTFVDKSVSDFTITKYRPHLSFKHQLSLFPSLSLPQSSRFFNLASHQKSSIANPFPPPSPAILFLQKAKKPSRFVNPDGSGCSDEGRDLPLMVSDLDNGHLGFALRCLLKFLVGVVTTHSPAVTNGD